MDFNLVILIVFSVVLFTIINVCPSIYEIFNSLYNNIKKKEYNKMKKSMN